MNAEKETGKKLPPMQARFVQEYIVDLNATQAAIRAGYSAKTAEMQGSRLLSKAKVQATLMVAMKAREIRTEITQDWVIRELAENVAMAKGAIPVLDRQGNPIGTYVYDGQVANGALKLLGDHLQMFPKTPPVAVNVDNRKLAFTISFDTPDGFSPNGHMDGAFLNGNRPALTATDFDDAIDGDET